MLGNTLRLAIAALWLGLTGWYLVRYALPDMGLLGRGDPSAAFSQRVDQVQHYAVLWRPKPDAEPKRIGGCAIGALTDDVGIRLQTQLEITETSFIPGVQLIRKAIGGKRSAGIRLRLDEMLDANMRLTRVEVSGAVFGIPFSADGPVDHRGLDLKWKAGDANGTRLIPEVRPERVSGGELAGGLPARLKAGDTFTTRISSIDPARMRLATKEAVFQVSGPSAHRTAAGQDGLVEVEMRVDGRRFAILHADATGTVHRQELADGGIAIELTHMTDAFGRRTWPVPDPEPAVRGADPTPP